MAPGLRVLALTALLAVCAAPGHVIAAPAAAAQAQLDTVIDFYRKEGAEKALPQFLEVLDKTAQQSRSSTRAVALQYVGECYWRLGNYDASKKYLERALAMHRALGDRGGEGKTLNVWGLLDWDQGNYESAQSRFRTAARIGAEIGDRRLQGSALNNLGLVLDELGDYDGSLANYRQALELYRGADFARGEGDTLGNIGGVHLLLGRYREAMRYYEQALAISQKLGSKTSLSQDNGNIGTCLLGLGQIDAALRRFDLAITQSRQAGMRRDEAYWLREKANAQVQQGRYELALPTYRLALKIHEELDAKAGRVESLTDVGRLYLLIGDTASARNAFTQASKVASEMGFDRGYTASLLAVGEIEERSEQFDKAAASYRAALARANKSRQPQLIAASMLRLASLQLATGQVNDAETNAVDAGAVAKRGDYRLIRAESEVLLGEVAMRRRQPAKAHAHYQAAREANAAIGDPEILWRIDFGRARAFESQGNVTAAIEALESAAGTIESVRSRLEQPRFRSSYVENKQDVYRALVRLKLGQGRVEDAFDAAERMRARSFDEHMQGQLSRPLSVEQRAREAELRERVRHLRVAAADATDEESVPFTQRARERFSKELLRAEQEYQAFLDEYGGTASRSAGSGASVARRSQERLGPRQALLEYVVGREATTVFLMRKDRLIARSVAVRDVDLASQVALLNDLITDRAGDDQWLKPAARLFERLIEPLHSSGALNGVDHLYVVPTGPLTSLPFAVLPMRAPRSTLLVERFSIAYLPSAAMLSIDGKAAGPENLLAVAPAKSRLPYAIDEGRRVAEMYKPHSRTLLGKEATESRFKQEASRYSIVHVASHGKFDKANPLFSGIELEPDQASDGLLQVHEVLGLKMRASLVNLSACETARASGYFLDSPQSDDLIGLARAFLLAGSRAVLATLAPVEDRSSFRTMQLFYGQMRSRGNNAATALAAAQRLSRQNPSVAHPYYWAPYVVIGVL